VMSPLAAAISMPASTLTLLVFTVTSLKPRAQGVPASAGFLSASANASTPAT
jgi:hypothetical protein